MLTACYSSSINSVVVDGNKTNSIEEYLHSISGQEKEPDAISVDHSYSKSWSSHPDCSHAKPVRLLFMKSVYRLPEGNVDVEPCVDVEDKYSPVVPPYDCPRTRSLMDECDLFLKSSLSQELEEEQVNKSGWTSLQRNLHKQVMKVLQTNRLSRLASVGAVNELVKRKVMIDKAARRVRQLFATHAWDMQLLCWLHQNLMDSLSAPMLSEYFEILRALKAKIPNLIDKLLAQVTSFHSGIFGNCSTEAFTQLLKRPWDPVLSMLTQQKPKKLTANPLFITVPNAPNQTISNQNHRMRFINSHIGSLGKVIYSPIHASGNLAVEECLDQIYATMKNKVIELKSQYPTRPIVLVGWTVGALIACHIALEETVSAVVCFGFPLKGVSGSRGDLDDPLLDINVPVLFLIGQNATTCSMDDIEDFRERMKAETGLVVVGGADDMLRISAMKKRTEGVTQAMVDRCLADEVGDFVGSVLNQQYAASLSALGKRPYTSTSVQSQPQQKELDHQPPPPPPQQQQDQELKQQQQAQISPTDGTKRPRRRPREYSPDFSPVKRKPRQRHQHSRKRHMSSSSSDTSSTGSCVHEGIGKREKKKKSSFRKVRRSTSPFARRRMGTKSVVRRHKIIREVPERKDSGKLKSSPQPLMTTSAEIRVHVTESTQPAPSAVNKKPDLPKILSMGDQRKNGSVDVEKAFGKDSSFLPRPLTPAELESTDVPSTVQTTEITDKLLPGSEATDSNVSLPQEQVISEKPNLIGVPISTVIATPEKQRISYLKTGTGTFPLARFSTNVNSTFAIQRPQVVSKVVEPTASISSIQSVEKLQAGQFAATTSDTLNANKSPVVPHTKIIPASALNIKHIQGTLTSLSGKSLLTPSPGLSSKPQTILVASSSAGTIRPATYLVSGSDAKSATPKTIQFRRMVVKSPSCPAGKLPLPALSKLSTTSGSSTTIVSGDISQKTSDQPFEQKVCNLSLLSDVAGMKEPIRQVSRDIQTPTGATLVKLASPADIPTFEKPGPSQIRRFRVIETIPSALQPPPPPPACIETPEEFAEKQMAIRALNSSLNEEGSTSNYSASYSRVESNLTPRPISKLSYSVVMPTPTGIGTRQRAPFYFNQPRGTRSFPGGRKPRVQRFYPFQF